MHATSGRERQCGLDRRYSGGRSDSLLAYESREESRGMGEGEGSEGVFKKAAHPSSLCVACHCFRLRILVLFSSSFVSSCDTPIFFPEILHNGRGWEVSPEWPEWSERPEQQGEWPPRQWGCLCAQGWSLQLWLRAQDQEGWSREFAYVSAPGVSSTSTDGDGRWIISHRQEASHAAPGSEVLWQEW